MSEVPHYDRLIFVADSTTLPSIDHVMRSTHSICCDIICRRQPLLAFHMRIDWSLEQDTKWSPFGLRYSTQLTLMFLALQRLMATEVSLRIPLPQLDGHIARATCLVVAGRNKSHIIDHARVLTLILLAFFSHSETTADRLTPVCEARENCIACFGHLQPTWRRCLSSLLCATESSQGKLALHLHL